MNKSQRRVAGIACAVSAAVICLGLASDVTAGT
jgi:hypothetical protein